jgi:O-antigen/teichoic acid export membrane protein
MRNPLHGLAGRLASLAPGNLKAPLSSLASGRVDVGSTYVLQVVSLGLGFVSQVAVARLAGVSGYGVYAYALAWSSIIVQPSLLGFDRVLIRELASYQKAGEFGHMRGLLRRSDQVALLAAVAFTAIIAAIAIPVSSPGVRVSVAIGMATIPLATVGRVRLASLQALRRAALGQLTQSVGRTVAFIVFLGVAVAISTSTSMPPEYAIGAQAAAFGAALVMGSIAVRRVLPPQVMRATPRFEHKNWVRSMPVLALFTFVTILNGQLPIILLGAIGTSSETGRFNAAWQSIKLITIALTSVGQVVAPRIPVLYASGDKEGIERLLTKATYASTALAIPPSLFLTVLGPWLLGLFGHGFREGGTTLVILVVGQLFNAATGSLGVALLMTKHERSATLAVVVGTALEALLCAVLIPLWGANGAAVATTAGTIFVNIFFVVAIVRSMGIRPVVLGVRLPKFS